jgi:hypothetical protein
VRSIKDLFGITTKREKTRGTLWAAIQARRVTEFYYHGGYRTVEPFALGVTMYGAAENESLICYQTEGYSDLQETVGWKLYRASEMEDLKVSREQFTGERPGYDPDNIDMVKIYDCVRPEKPAMKKVMETPGPLKVEPQPAIIAIEKQAPKYLTHDELMRRFRFTHPQPLPELDTYILSGPRIKRPPERTEWENRHFSGAFEGRVPRGANGLKFTALSAADVIPYQQAFVSRHYHCRTTADTLFSSSCSSLTPRTSRSVLRKARTMASMSLVLESFLPPLNLAVEARLSR